MIEIIVPETELFNNKTSEIIRVQKARLQLEHSLISISKWEQKHKKPYLTEQAKSYLETIDYIKCMTLNIQQDLNIYLALKNEHIDKINSYINDSMTATTIPKKSSSGKQEVLTSELIYYYMLEFGIPFECQKWHLNRLLTLIEVCAFKKSPPRKMSTNEIYARNKALNDARRKRYHTKG